MYEREYMGVPLLYQMFGFQPCGARDWVFPQAPMEQASRPENGASSGRLAARTWARRGLQAFMDRRARATWRGEAYCAAVALLAGVYAW